MVAGLANKSIGLCEVTDTPGVPKSTTSLCLGGITKAFSVCRGDLLASMSNYSYQLPVPQLIAEGNMQAEKNICIYICSLDYIHMLISSS